MLSEAKRLALFAGNSQTNDKMGKLGLHPLRCSFSSIDDTGGIAFAGP
jgi:hypothetical protein